MVTDASPDPRTELIRHTLATVAYRGAKALRGAPAGFGAYRVGPTSRTPAEILAHVGDLLEWSAWLLRGEHRWSDSDPLAWEEEVERFFGLADRLDKTLLTVRPTEWTLEQIFQGPIADALTHIGQLTMLRRLAGGPVRGENYAKAEILSGRVGPRQAEPRFEFD